MKQIGPLLRSFAFPVSVVTVLVEIASSDTFAKTFGFDDAERYTVKGQISEPDFGPSWYKGHTGHELFYILSSSIFPHQAQNPPIQRPAHSNSLRTRP